MISQQTSDKTIDLKMFLYCLYRRNCTARAVARPKHVAITACDWFSKFSSHSKNTSDKSMHKSRKSLAKAKETIVNFPKYDNLFI